MTLLRSITKASADAVPGLSASPLPWEGHRSRLRPREQYSRPGAAGGGSGSRGSPPSPGDFYRLPWYRRPLPSPRPSGAAASLDLRRRHSMLSAPRSGLRPPSTIVEGSLVSGGVGAARGRTAARDPPRPAPGQEASGKQCPLNGDFVAPVPRSRAVVKAPEPPPNMAPTVPPTQCFAAAAAAATTAATTAAAATTSEIVVAPQVWEKRGEALGVLEVVVADSTTAGANSMKDDPDVVAEGVPPANAGVGASVAVREVSGGEDSREIRRLKAELDRLKREMAAMAAATAAATTPQPGATGSDLGSPRIEVTTPVPSEGRSAWQWADGKPPGVSERPKSTRNLGRAVRADDSWMQRRRSGRYHHRRSSSESLTSGFVGGIMAGSVLPTPTSDGGSSGGQLSFSNRGGGHHHHHHAAVEALSPPRHSLGSLGEGPSPASGEKAEGAAAAAAERRADRRGSSAGGDRGSQNGSQAGSARSSASVRPFPVFFPVQVSRGTRGAEALAPLPRTKVPQDEPASAAAAVVAEAVEAAGAAATTKEKESVTAKRDNGGLGELSAPADGVVNRDIGGGSGGVGGGGSEEKPRVYDKVPERAASAAVATGRRRERPSVGRARVWRWVLAQRTGNQTVRQALLTHGLPPLDRRHIWAAWAAVAKPEGAASRRVGAPSDPAAQGSVASIIVHDVQRTKIVHPLFASGGPGMAMLKRVLLRCAELGAVKDAGYIQGMNYLAGFLLITFADCIAADRAPPTGEGTGGSSRDPASAAATTTAGGGGVSLQPELPPAIARGGAAGGEGSGEAEAQPTAADVELIEREAVEVMLGIIALQGGVLSRDLWGLHANTELVETLLSKHCPDIMEHLRTVSLELIVLTPRWFICIYAGSMASQPVVSRIWDLFTWYGRRGPAVLVWVALGILHGCRARILESRSLPAAVKAVRRHAEGCRSFDELIRQAPVGLNQVVAAWEEQGENRRIATMDGDGAVPDKMVAGLVQEMTGEQMLPPPMEDTSPQAHRPNASGYAPSTSTPAGFGIQFPSTPGRPPTPLSSPRSPFPDWAASIFRSSTGGGGGLDAEGFSTERGDGERPPASPRFDGTPARTRQLRRAASTSWW